ncbi:MAG: GDYXXLXY domain-containing protein [Actinomycetota bacterium]|nr:GDYXXLXY domain-containing protein [Actinomycetota bacterium]
MNPLAARSGRVALASVVQLALVALAVAGPLSARLTGEEYLLEVAPVDPVDPFRGAYVALSYPGLPGGGDLGDRPHGSGVVYVPLVRSGELWVARGVRTEPPDSPPYLRCHDDGWQLRCGIESWFLPQDDAYAMEQAVQDGRAVATVRIDGRGNAALMDVQVRDGK